MEKEFIPYEIASILKELGFDEKPCLANYYTDISGIGKLRFTEYYGEYLIKAPLYQQSFRFFREKYGLYFPINLDDCGQYYFEVNKEYDVCRNTYEEAELECLKKLISIVKERQ